MKVSRRFEGRMRCNESAETADSLAAGHMQAAQWQARCRSALLRGIMPCEPPGQLCHIPVSAFHWKQRPGPMTSVLGTRLDQNAAAILPGAGSLVVYSQVSWRQLVKPDTSESTWHCSGLLKACHASNQAASRQPGYRCAHLMQLRHARSVTQ